MVVSTTYRLHNMLYLPSYMLGSLFQCSQDMFSNSAMFHNDRKMCCMDENSSLLLLQCAGNRLIHIPEGSWAQGGCDCQQSIHLLILLQNLVILCATLVVRFHPAYTGQASQCKGKWSEMNPGPRTCQSNRLLHLIQTQGFAVRRA